MRDVEKALVAEAQRIVTNMQNRVRALEAELAGGERGDVYLGAQLHAMHASRERLASFAARIGGNYQCPRCWVRDGTKRTVRAVPSPNEDDLLRCDRCGRRLGGGAKAIRSALDASSGLFTQVTDNKIIAEPVTNKTPEMT
jgi:hypothetical protein